MWKNELIKAAEGVSAPMEATTVRLWEPAALGSAAGPPDSKCSYCLCTDCPRSSLGLLRSGCLHGGIPPPQEGRKGAGTSISQSPGVQPVNTVCLKYCAVSCFNKGPQGLTWAITHWSGRDRCSQINLGKGCFSTQIPRDPPPTPSPNPRLFY